MGVDNHILSPEAHLRLRRSPHAIAGSFNSQMTGGLLNSTDLIPSPILKHIAIQLGGEVWTPVVASIRALYRNRRRTLFDHQAAAMQVIGFEHFTGSAQPHLVSMLRKGAADCFDLEGPIEHARVWLYEHRFVVLTSRTLRSLAGRCA